VPEIRTEIPIHSVIAGADETDRDAVVGRGLASHTEHRRRHNLGHDRG